MRYMAKQYYVKHWKTLDSLYKELETVTEIYNEDPTNEHYIMLRMKVIRKIKHFLRYRSKYEDYYIRP